MITISQCRRVVFVWKNQGVDSVYWLNGARRAPLYKVTSARASMEDEVGHRELKTYRVVGHRVDLDQIRVDLADDRGHALTIRGIRWQEEDETLHGECITALAMRPAMGFPYLVLHGSDSPRQPQ